MQAFFDVGGQWVQELGPTEEQASTAVQSYDWNSPDLGNYLVNGSFEVRACSQTQYVNVSTA